MRSLLITYLALIHLGSNAQVNYFNKQYDIPPDVVDSVYYFAGLSSVALANDSGYIAAGFSNQYSIVEGFIIRINTQYIIFFIIK